MGNKRTLHRRAARKRAKQRKLERLERWASMSPEQREIHDHIMGCFKSVYEEAIRDSIRRGEEWKVFVSKLKV